MGAGSPGNPVGLDPFRNIVNVAWPGRYIAFLWRFSFGPNSALLEDCAGGADDPSTPFGFYWLDEVLWTVRDIEHIDPNDMFETTDGGKTWFGADPDDYTFSGQPGTPIPNSVTRVVETIGGIPDWQYVGTAGVLPTSFVFDPPNRAELIPNGSIIDVPIPDPTTGGTSGHPTERFMDATNLIAEVDRALFANTTNWCRIFTFNSGGDGALHKARELASGASRAEDLDGQVDLSTVEAVKDGRRYVGHGFHKVSDLDFWFLLKHVGPAAG